MSELESEQIPSLTKEERKNGIILLHCKKNEGGCGHITKHQTLDNNHGKPTQLKYTSPWHGARAKQIYTTQYPRKCLECGNVTKF